MQSVRRFEKVPEVKFCLLPKAAANKNQVSAWVAILVKVFVVHDRNNKNVISL